MLLRLDSLQRHFGGVKAVDGVSLEIDKGSIFGLIGPNGAGKTTLVNVVTGYVRTQSGQAFLEKDHLTGLPPHRIAGLGIARTFQNIRLFPDLSALENVMIGMHTRLRDDTVVQLATLPFLRRDQRARVNDAHRLMETVGLDASEVGKRSAGELPYGDQRRLEIARALALSPRLLILDEPAAGMNPTEKQGMRELIERLNRDGLTILLIDHDMRLVMGVCRQVAVLNFGRKIADGDPEAVSADATVIKAYLGTGGEKEVAHAPGTIEVNQLQRAAQVRSSRVVEPEKALLDVQDMWVSYGAINAVRGVSLRVGAGEVVALIGANGAGKSTILNALSGLVPIASGTAVFGNLDLTNGRALRASTLSGGERQLLAIARGLLARPKLLLLDEPSLGLAPQMVDEVFAAIAEIHRDGTTILLVEQNALRALGIADRAYVLETGQIQLTGGGQDLLHNPAVRQAYLGG